jgi:hypothetical protein
MTLDTDVLSVVPFLDLRRLLDLVLLPVAPRREFRRHLREQLISEATQRGLPRRAQDMSSVGNSLILRGGHREIIIGAAVGSAVSLVGLIAFLLHLRSNTRNVTTTAA